MALFQKPKFDQKEYLQKLEQQVFLVSQELEGLQGMYGAKIAAYEYDFDRRKETKEKELFELSEKVAFLRSERSELEKPIDHKRKALYELEQTLVEKEQALIAEQQKAFEKEREAEKKLESVQELADELGEARIRVRIKENALLGREESLKDKEAQYLVKVEKFSKEVNESAALIQERENALLLKELNFEGKVENIARREKELLEGHILLNDRNIMLEKGWAELKAKQHGSSIKLISKRR